MGPMVFTLFIWRFSWLALLLAYLFVEPILVHKGGKLFFLIIVFGSLSQQSDIRAWLFGFFFFCVLKWMMA